MPRPGGVPPRTPALSRRLFAGLGAAALLSGCGIGLAEDLGPLPAGSPILRETGLAYGPAARHRLQVYHPAGATAAMRLPLVVLFHGGFWQMSDMDEGQMHGLAQRLARRGVVVALANYRLYPEVTFPGFVEDGAAALAWAARQAPAYGACPARLFAAGHSAGGHIAAMLGVEPGFLAPHGIRLAGAIGIAGPYGEWFQDHPLVAGVFPPETRPRSSPIALAGPRSAPLLLLGAGLDVLVRPSDSLALAARARAAGVAAEAHVFAAATHTSIMSGLVPVADLMCAFMRRVAPGPDRA